MNALPGLDGILAVPCTGIARCIIRSAGALVIGYRVP